VRGGADVGHYLATTSGSIMSHHRSDKTYDAIVFGSGREARPEKPRTDPSWTSSLGRVGNVSPIIVVPGKWTAAELIYQAEHVATMVVNNAGFKLSGAG